jgi:hypothetical protein
MAERIQPFRQAPITHTRPLPTARGEQTIFLHTLIRATPEPCRDSPKSPATPPKRATNRPREFPLRTVSTMSTWALRLPSQDRVNFVNLAPPIALPEPCQLRQLGPFEAPLRTVSTMSTWARQRPQAQPLSKKPRNVLRISAALPGSRAASLGAPCLRSSRVGSLSMPGPASPCVTHCASTKSGKAGLVALWSARITGAALRISARPAILKGGTARAARASDEHEVDQRQVRAGAEVCDLEDLVACNAVCRI